ncbi:MAG: lipid-A-disaccharide synthase [Caulobacterales bacterium]
MKPLKVMMVATEASGDALAAGLARALRARLGAQNVSFVGVGGARMLAEGMPSLFDIGQLSILGLDVSVIPRALRLLSRTAHLAQAERPDAVVLVDSWAFSILLAQRLRRRLPGAPLIKYVGPQVWATRPWRAKALARAVDLLLAINSFEPPYFEAEGLRTVFVGNPVFARDLSGADPHRLRAAIGAGPDDPILLILPGSRPTEIRRLMGPFEDAVALLKSDRPRLHLVLAAADTVAGQVKASIAGWPNRVHVVEGEAARFDAMRAATVALACSGTVTTELALAGCPMVVAYRLGPMTYIAARILMHSPFVTLINIAAGKAIAPELLQGDCTGPRLARELALRLDDPALRARQIAEQDAATRLMGRGGPDPSQVAADAVLELLTERKVLPSRAP